MATSKRGGKAKKTTAKRGTAAKKAAPKKAAVKKAAPKKAAVKRAAAKRTPRARAAKPVPGVPAGFHTITPSLVFKGTAATAIGWYKTAFGAEEVSRMTSPDGTAIWHAEVKIGDSILFASDESPMGNTVAPSGPKTATASIQLYVPDADAWAARAIAAGAKVVMPVGDMFWGDRMGVFEDPFGHPWLISTRVKHLTEAEMQHAAAEFVKQMAQHVAPPQPPEG
jgi:PhnB protein